MKDIEKQVNKHLDAIKKTITEKASKNEYIEEEIEAFSLEMRCCFFVQPFNKSILPKTVEEWATEVGWLQFDIDGCFYDCAVRQAIKEASRLIEFVKKESSL